MKITKNYFRCRLLVQIVHSSAILVCFYTILLNTSFSTSNAMFGSFFKSHASSPPAEKIAPDNTFAGGSIIEKLIRDHGAEVESYIATTQSVWSWRSTIAMVEKLLQAVCSKNVPPSISCEQLNVLNRFFEHPDQKQLAINKIKNIDPVVVDFLTNLYGQLKASSIRSFDELTRAIHRFNVTRLHIDRPNEDFAYGHVADHINKKLPGSVDYAVSDENYYVPTACFIFISHLYWNEHLTFTQL